MGITFVLLPLAIGLSLLSLGLFVWAMRSGQFEDLEGPRWRMLFDDEEATVARGGRHDVDGGRLGASDTGGQEGPAADGERPHP